ncbi:MAG TPA: hypothetical protein VHD62_11125, partial [Opitutaceae bacterium]|nr:hypothetical protein [Opitutaceae bacterium]
NAGDRARVEVNGGALVLMQDSLRLGEYTGSAGEFVLRDGAMHCAMDVFVGAASAVPGRATHATLRIAGGSFLGRTLTVGAGLGAQSLVAIDGSRAAAVHVLDYLYLEGLSAPDGTAGESTLSFTLDAQGVTPITIQSRADGLRIIRNGAARCRLRVQLSAVPPREDVTLVSAHVATRGTFDGVAEGSEVTAMFGGRTYRWQVTYRGGAGGHDLVLQNRSTYAADAPVTHVRPPPDIPVPLWTQHRIFPLELSAAGEKAFDGAEGYGAFAAGGRGGRTVFVDTLDDSGPGSLRAALAASGPRIVVFRVGGVIALQSALRITEPFLTREGATAPGAGILLRNHGLQVETHDVVLRHLRIRVGDDDVRTGAKPLSYYTGGEGDYALYFTGATNCIADHLSLSWSTSKMLSVTKMSDRITIQWCLLGESLNFADHGYASIAGGNRVTWHHNLFAHHLSRSVRFQGMVDADFRNNVIYDWGHTAGYGEFDRLNYVGNYLVPGPSTTQRPRLFHTGAEVVANGAAFVAGNVLAGDPKATEDNWRGMGYYYFDRERLAARAPFPAPPVATDSAEIARERVLAAAGATLPRRDAVDERIVREVRDGSGRIVKSVAEAGGWPDFPATTK